MWTNKSRIAITSLLININEPLKHIHALRNMQIAMLIAQLTDDMEFYKEMFDYYYRFDEPTARTQIVRYLELYNTLEQLYLNDL